MLGMAGAFPGLAQIEKIQVIMEKMGSLTIVVLCKSPCIHSCE